MDLHRIGANAKAVLNKPFLACVFLLVAFVMASTKQEHSHTGLHQPKWHHTTFTKQFKLSVTTIVSEDGPALAFKILLPMLFVCRIISLDLIFWEVLCSKNNTQGECRLPLDSTWRPGFIMLPVIGRIHG